MFDSFNEMTNRIPTMDDDSDVIIDGSHYHMEAPEFRPVIMAIISGYLVTHERIRPIINQLFEEKYCLSDILNIDNPSIKRVCRGMDLHSEMIVRKAYILLMGDSKDHIMFRKLAKKVSSKLIGKLEASTCLDLEEGRIQELILYVLFTDYSGTHPTASVFLIYLIKAFNYDLVLNEAGLNMIYLSEATISFIHDDTGWQTMTDQGRRRVNSYYEHLERTGEFMPEEMASVANIIEGDGSLHQVLMKLLNINPIIECVFDDRILDLAVLFPTSYDKSLIGKGADFDRYDELRDLALFIAGLVEANESAKDSYFREGDSGLRDDIKDLKADNTKLRGQIEALESRLEEIDSLKGSIRHLESNHNKTIAAVEAQFKSSERELMKEVDDRNEIIERLLKENRTEDEETDGQISAEAVSLDESLQIDIFGIEEHLPCFMDDRNINIIDARGPIRTSSKDSIVAISWKNIGHKDFFRVRDYAVKHGHKMIYIDSINEDLIRREIAERI